MKVLEEPTTTEGFALDFSVEEFRDWLQEQRDTPLPLIWTNDQNNCPLYHFLREEKMPDILAVNGRRACRRESELPGKRLVYYDLPGFCRGFVARFDRLPLRNSVEAALGALGADGGI